MQSAHVVRKNTGAGHGRTAARDRRRDAARAAGAMLNVPTLWMVFVVNFSALGLIWAYVTRYLSEIRGCAVLDGIGLRRCGRRVAALVRLFVDSSMPLLFGGRRLIVAVASPPWASSASMTGRCIGASWRTGASFAGLVLFKVGCDSMQLRMLSYSVGQGLPLVLTLRLLLSPPGGPRQPGRAAGRHRQPH